MILRFMVYLGRTRFRKYAMRYWKRRYGNNFYGTYRGIPLLISKGLKKEEEMYKYNDK
jgi:hypothetical protein